MFKRYDYYIRNTKKMTISVGKQQSFLLISIIKY